MVHYYTISTAAASRMLCQKATVETELGITAGSQDAKLNRLILAASMVIRNELGRDPWLQTYVEHIAGNGGTDLVLDHWPVLGDPASVTLGTGSSPDTVTASLYSVGGGSRRDRLFKTGLWSVSDVIEGAPVYGAQQPDINVTYTAGWVMPDQITQWSATASVAASAWYSSTDVDEPMIFQADSSGGTTGGTEPTTWPTAPAGTVTDNGITWTAYDQRLPEALEEAALMLVGAAYEGGWSTPVGIASEAAEGFRIQYAMQSDALSRSVRALVGAYR